MAKKNFQIPLPLEIGEKLQQLAAENGLWWGQSGNATQLTKLVAEREIPLMPLVERKQLPDAPGIYFGLDADGLVLYVGKAESLRDRFLRESNRLQELQYNGVVGIAWMPCSGNLEEVAQTLIAELSPELNDLNNESNKASALQGNVLIASANALLEKGDRENLKELARWAAVAPGTEAMVVEELQRLAGIENVWVSQVEEFIEKHQPFVIVTPRNSYHCHYADFWIAPEGQQRQQLRVWCEEEGDADVPELLHNRSFKLNRGDIEISPLPDRRWRYQGLDTIEAILRLKGGLARNYQPREEDIQVAADDSDLLVVKKIWSDWWLLATARRYGENCEIVSPASLRQKMGQEARAIAKLHQLS